MLKFSRYALLGALAASSFAADGLSQGLQQPVAAHQTAYEYSNYYAQDEESAPSPSDLLVPTPAEEPSIKPPVDANAPPSGTTDDYYEPNDRASAPATTYALPCYDSCCDHRGCCDGLLTLGGLLDPCATLGEPCTLSDTCCLPCGTKIAGWLGQSFTWNTTNPADRFNGPVAMTDRSNEWQLNQMYLYAERATSNDVGWDLGGRVDLLYGTDNRFTTAAGLETQGYYQDPKWTGYRFYGLAMPQLYAAVQRGDLTVKVGHFYAPVGYEVVQMIGNFFPTLPYTFEYGEPFTFTGVVASYALSEDTSIGGGFTRGWDNWGGGETYRNPHLGGLVTMNTRLGEGTLAMAWVFGPEGTQAAGFRNRFLQTMAYSLQLEDNWSTVLQSDFGYQNDAVITGNNDAYWYGLNGYLFKKISDRWTWGMRAEWFRDQDGARVGGYMGDTADGSLRGLSLGRVGYAGNFYAITLGANWRPTANWIVRPQVRFDWFQGDLTANNTEGDPFDGGNGNSQTLIGFDAIYTF